MNEMRKLMETIRKIEESPTGGFSGTASQARHEIEWIKKKIDTLRPQLAKKPSTIKQIKDLQRQIRERELAITFSNVDYDSLPPEAKRRLFLYDLKEDSNEVDLKLRRGKKVVLEAVATDFRRGLIVELMEGGGYNVEYWYEDPSNIMPSEVKVDGRSIKDNAKLVYLGFHPEKGDTDEDALPESNGILPDNGNGDYEYADSTGSNNEPYGPDWEYWAGGNSI